MVKKTSGTPPNEVTTWVSPDPQSDVTIVVITVTVSQQETPSVTTPTGERGLQVSLDLELCVKPGTNILIYVYKEYFEFFNHLDSVQNIYVCSEIFTIENDFCLVENAIANHRKLTFLATRTNI